MRDQKYIGAILVSPFLFYIHAISINQYRKHIKKTIVLVVSAFTVFLMYHDNQRFSSTHLSFYILAFVSPYMHLLVELLGIPIGIPSIGIINYKHIGIAFSLNILSFYDLLTKKKKEVHVNFLKM